MNVAAFIEYLNKTKGLQIDASYYAKIEKWRQWWQGYVPSVHNIKITREDGEHKRRRASLRMPKRVCEDWANLLLNDKTTFQIGDAATAAYLLGSDEQQTGGLCGSCISGRTPTSWWRKPTGPAPALSC